MQPTVRFDDLTPGAESSFELSGFVEAVAADVPGDVGPALAKAEDLSASGRWLAGFVSYDAAPGFDPGLVVPGPDAGSSLPLLWFGAFEQRVAIEPLREPDSSMPVRPAWSPEVDEASYHRAIAEIRDRIAAGDTYQVNHTFRLRAGFEGDPLSFYAGIALAQGSGYCAFFDLGRFQIASASPEQFFRVDGSRIRVKPMKGTARRGRWPEEDAAMAARLQASEKDRAENLMIVDLLRNDLGRISRFGTVGVERLLDLERYDTVWQLTSEISADLRPDVGLSEIFSALFPSGSVTGAPKRRTMEIIRSLETSSRGIYCGAIGYVAPQRGQGGTRASFNVAIRTATIDKERGSVEYGVGGGITWDSTAEAEYEEAIAKSDVLRVPPRPAALLETLRWDPGAGYRLINRHLERLEASCEYFGVPWNLASVAASLKSSVAGAEAPVVVRLTLDTSGAVSVEQRELADRFGTPEDPGPGAVVVLSVEPVSSRDRMLFHKTTAREPYERRKRQHPEADDVLLVNERGEITESTIANVAVDFGSGWVTPPLESGCLPGTYRAELLDTGVLREEVVMAAGLEDADRLALVNSVRGWRPATIQPASVGRPVAGGK